MYMPRRDGFALIEWLRDKPEYAGVRVMILSSGPTADHRARAKELHVASYLTKPVRQSTLFDAIATALGPAEAPPAAPAAAPVPQPALGVRPLQILLAEDNPVNQMTATTMFEKLGHAVVVANNGRQAIDKINGQAFDVVFMDVQMPEMDGVTATGEIRKSEQGTGRHIPIVAMTAHAMKGDKEKCLEAGMDDYVPKPIRRKDLSDVIGRIVERFLTKPAANAEPAAASVADANEGGRMILDETALLEECDNDKALLRRMVEIFDSDATGRLPRLREAVRTGNAVAVKQEAHALKGGVGAFYAKEAYDTAYVLEKMGADGNLSNAQAVLQTLESQLQSFRKKLDELIQS
jgi:CheY-like chemotaxis protein